MSSEEIKQIKETLKYYETTKTEPTYCEELITTGELKRTVEEIERLNNIINELEKWLKEKQILYGINQQGFSCGVCGEALDKLQELKGDGSNEKEI